MPASVVGTGSGVVTSSRTASVTLDTPALTGDVVKFTVASVNPSAAATAPATWVMPTPTSGANPVSSDSQTQVIVYHEVTSGENNTTVFTATNLWNATQTGNVTALLLRAVDLANPIDSLVTAFDSSFQADPHVLPALTGSNLSTDSLVTGAVSMDSTGSYTTPGGLTARVSNNNNLQQAVFSYDTLTTAGTNVAAVNVVPDVEDEYTAITAAWTSAVSAASGDGTFAATAAITGTGQADASGSGDLAATASIVGAGAADVGSEAQLLVTVTITGAGEASASGSGDLSASTSTTGAGQADAAGAGDLAADTTSTGAGEATASGAGDLAAAADIAGAGSIPGATFGAGNLAADADTTGTGQADTSGSGELTVDTTSSGAGQADASGMGTLTVSIALVGSGEAVTVGTATVEINTAITGAGSVSGEMTGSGVLEIPVSIIGEGSTSQVVATGWWYMPEPAEPEGFPYTFPYELG